MTGKNIWVGRFLLSVIMAFGLAVSGCDSSSGSDGAEGPAGPEGPEGPEGPAGPGLDPIDAAIAASKLESCSTCHKAAGEEHQAQYDGYVDESALELTLTDVNSVGTCSTTTTTACTADATCPAGETCLFEVTVDFRITKNGLPFIDEAMLPSLDQVRFYTVQYNSTTGEYLNGNQRLRTIAPVDGSPGDYTVTQTGITFAPESPGPVLDGSHVYGYIAQTPALEHTGGTGAEFPEGTHVHLYEDVSNAAIAYGTAIAADPASYESQANVGQAGGQAGCVNCHGEPYLKHGYRAAQIDTCGGGSEDPPCSTDAECDPITCDPVIPDFAACKTCHYDDRSGGHEDWQYMVDQPLNWGTAGLPRAEVKTLYAYTANIMNDTHMSHGMEFPYPMSMANCATCHDGKLSPGVLDDTNFTSVTCRSCHSVLGTDAWPGEDYYQGNRAPALEYLWTEAGVDGFHTADLTCNSAGCHGSTASSFNVYHTGYDVRISDSDGNRYADTYTVSIDEITLAGNLLTIALSASPADAGIVPEVLVSFYGWDSKHFLVPSHQRDGSELCTGRSGDPDGCDMEYPPGAGDNPLFTDNTAIAGSWSVTLDMAAYQAELTDDIPTLIANGEVKKAEITVTPELTLGDVDVALNAVTQTFDLGTGTDVENYYKGDNAIVDVNKCNACHDQLAVTFHSGSGRGGDIVACRNCHNTTFDGSHLEMTSRSTENYVHAIHTFQAFDTDDVFEEFDPVFSARYNQHIQHVFPNFTIRNCEGCHFEGTYNVPDQSQSMPGVQSTSYEVATWYEMVSSGRVCSTTNTQVCTETADCPTGETCVGNIPSSIAIDNPAGRNIGTVASYVTGPASRACGGCHRARLINDDAAGDLASFNSHTQVNGTYVPNDPDDEVLYGVIDKIMGMFE